MDALLETSENAKIEELLRAADDAASKGDNTTALRRVTEALEIDDCHVEALHRRVAYYLNEFDFLSAENDAEKLILVKPNDSRGHVARGSILQHISHHREALSCYLKALELGHTPEDEVASQLCRICVALNCASRDSFTSDVSGMDYYSQVAEIGVSFLRAKQYLMALEVLQTALKLKEGQPQATVLRVHLAAGHAFSALRHYDEALLSYGACQELGTSCGDVEHVAKSLVNIASIYSETGNSHKSLLYYEMLLDLHQGVSDDRERGRRPVNRREDVFTDSFLASLYMNASVAYKAIGNSERALRFAEAYFAASAGGESKVEPETLAHYRHLGSLRELTRDYVGAIQSYKQYLGMSKSLGSRSDVGYAYGCLGNVYGQLRLWPLALVMHERHITLAERSKERAACLAAYEMYGDSLMRRGQHESASEAYGHMARFCERNVLAAATAWCKLGHSHYCSRHYQRALHYFETALRVSKEEHAQARLDAKYGIACCLQKATDVADLEKGRKHFEDLIEAVGAQIETWLTERRSRPQHLLLRMNFCYDGAQMVLSKLGNDLECLLCAERWRSRSAAIRLPAGEGGLKPPAVTADSLMESLNRQSSTIVYYSLLDEVLLIWLLIPRKGLVRFYVRRPEDKVPVAQRLSSLLRQLLGSASGPPGLYGSDSRDLGAVNRFDDSDPGSTTQQWPATPSCDDGVSGAARQFLLEKTLYKLILGPVDDVIQKLDVGSTLVIVADKILSLCPFPFLRDLRGDRIMDRYRITCVPGMFALDFIDESEIVSRRAADDMESLKLNARVGGLFRFCSTLSSTALSTKGKDEKTLSDLASIDPRRTTNPRHLHRLRASFPADRPRLSKQTTRDNLSHPVGTFLQKLPTDGRLLHRKRSADEQTFFSACCGVDYVAAQLSAAGNAEVPLPSKHVRLSPGPGSPRSFNKTLRLRHHSTLITRTSTGTDCVRSPYGVPNFYQASATDRSLVVGNPLLLPRSMMLRGSTWYAPETSAPCGAELQAVSSILKCDAVTGSAASKRRFLELLPTATLVHLATFMDLHDGIVALASDTSRTLRATTVEERHYVVTGEDILKSGARAKLVVLSGGSAPSVAQLLTRHEIGTSGIFQLATAFIAAGAKSVVVFPLRMPDAAMEEFLHSFYMQFAKGCLVSDALHAALKRLVDGEKVEPVSIFPYLHIGKDVFIDALDIKSAMLDQAIDALEREVEGKSSTPLLNLSPSEMVLDPKLKIYRMQEALTEILELESPGCHIIGELINLIIDSQGAIRRKGRGLLGPRTLSKSGDTAPVRRILLLVGFEIEDCSLASGHSQPTVVPPHWDPDGLLERCSKILSAVRDICEESVEVKTALYDALPLDQVTLSYLADVFVITKHSPNVQLRVTDKAVQLLWNDSMCRTLLQRLGFAQIGTAIHFNRTPRNSRLVDASVQLAVMLCLHKTAQLVEKMDPKQLGPPPALKEEQAVYDYSARLPSLMPLLVTPQEMSMRVPWVSCPELPDEMAEKMKLARKYSLNKRIHGVQKRELSQLHENVTAGWAAEVMKDIGLPPPKPDVVKVVPNSSASRERVPLDYSQPLSGQQLAKKRELSSAILHRRLDETSRREKHELISFMRPYCSVLD